jgi:hypothetical protein
LNYFFLHFNTSKCLFQLQFTSSLPKNTNHHEITNQQRYRSIFSFLLIKIHKFTCHHTRNITGVIPINIQIIIWQQERLLLANNNKLWVQNIILFTITNSYYYRAAIYIICKRMWMYCMRIEFIFLFLPCHRFLLKCMNLPSDEIQYQIVRRFHWRHQVFTPRKWIPKIKKSVMEPMTIPQTPMVNKNSETKGQWCIGHRMWKVIHQAWNFPILKCLNHDKHHDQTDNCY